MKTVLLALTYIRAIFHWVWLFIFTVLSILIILSFEMAGCKKKSYQATRFWAFGLLWFCGIKVSSKNRCNIPKTPFLILFNHRSYIDILVLFWATPERLHFGAKKILFSIPLFGFAMKKMGHIPIQRESPKKMHYLYKSLQERVKNGDCFALSPEGGRHTGSGLARFKKGPFVFALYHQITALPVLIHKAEECMPKGSWFFNIGAWSRTVVVEYLSPVPAKGMDKNNVGVLRDRIYETMAKCIIENQVSPRLQQQ